MPTFEFLLGSRWLRMLEVKGPLDECLRKVMIKGVLG